VNEDIIRRLITAGELPTVEFKSNREPLADAELLNTVVCLANAQGAFGGAGKTGIGGTRTCGLLPAARRQGERGCLNNARAHCGAPERAFSVVAVCLPDGEWKNARRFGNKFWLYVFTEAGTDARHGCTVPRIRRRTSEIKVFLLQ
jgi:hypothetical protein